MYKISSKNRVDIQAIYVQAIKGNSLQVSNMGRFQAIYKQPFQEQSKAYRGRKEFQGGQADRWESPQK